MSKPTVAIIGKRKSCSYCAKLYALTKNGALSKLLPGADVVDADPAASQADFDKWRKLAKASGRIPIVAVFGDNGELVGKYVGRSSVVSPFTVQRLAAIINGVCAECSIPDVKADPVTPAEDGGCVVCSCGAKVAYCQACGKRICE